MCVEIYKKERNILVHSMSSFVTEVKYRTYWFFVTMVHKVLSVFLFYRNNSEYCKHVKNTYKCTKSYRNFNNLIIRLLLLFLRWRLARFYGDFYRFHILLSRRKWLIYCNNNIVMGFDFLFSLIPFFCLFILIILSFLEWIVRPAWFWCNLGDRSRGINCNFKAWFWFSCQRLKYNFRNFIHIRNSS